MNHPGEIARLAAMARPTIALVNNAQREHQEFMATVEAVARENGAVLSALPDNGTAVFPHGDAFTRAVERNGARRRVAPLPDLRRTTRCRHRAGDAPSGSSGAWQFEARTPLGELKSHAAHRRSPQRGQRAGGGRLRARRAACRSTSIAEGLAAFEPVKGRSSASRTALADRPRDHAGRRQLQRQSRFRARRHRRARRAARPAPAGAGRHGRGRRPGPAVSMPRSARGRTSAASTRCSRSATNRAQRRGLCRRRRPADARGTSTTSRRSTRPCSRACRDVPACWSRARASCGWSGWRRPSPRLPTRQQDKEAGHAG